MLHTSGFTEYSLVSKMSILTSEFVIFTLNAVVTNGDRHQKLKVT